MVLEVRTNFLSHVPRAGFIVEPLRHSLVISRWSPTVLLVNFLRQYRVSLTEEKDPADVLSPLFLAGHSIAQTQFLPLMSDLNHRARPLASELAWACSWCTTMGVFQKPAWTWSWTHLATTVRFLFPPRHHLPSPQIL